MSRLLIITLPLAAMALAAPAFAQVEAEPAQLQVESETTSIEATAVAPSATEGSAFDATPLSENVLKVQAGRADTAMVAQSNSNAVVANNSVGDNSVTGQLNIQDNAFQNLSGLSLVNVNTGNNVAMNSSMNVNISITPGQ